MYENISSRICNILDIIFIIFDPVQNKNILHRISDIHQPILGLQCVPNDVIAGLYISIVLVSRLGSHSLDNIL